MRTSLTKAVVAAMLTTVALLVLAPAASACGFLVSANGGVRLTRTTTFVAWEDGVEHYITSFAFEGELESFGSLVPLPAEPTDVQKAGSWTLQRLVREVRPEEPSLERRTAAFAEDAASDGDVEVLIETRIDSLDIVVLRGGSQAVLAWVNDNGFNLPPGPATDHMLSYYGSRSPYWMATRFDAQAAIGDGFTEGDGIPVQVTIPTVQPWVPLHILHGAAADSQIIEADVFLLTPDRPELMHGEGLELNQSKRASDLLLDDLRSEEGMEWVPTDGWFTHLEMETPAENVTYDLSVGVGEVAPSPVAAGFELADDVQHDFHAAEGGGGSVAAAALDDHAHGGVGAAEILVAVFAALAAGLLGVLIGRERAVAGDSA